MKYRLAKNLKVGESVTRKKDGMILCISSIEVFGQFKTVKVTCRLTVAQGGCEYVAGSTYVSLFNDEIE